MTRPAMSVPVLALALVVGLAGCAVPPDAGQAAGPTGPAVTASETAGAPSASPSPDEPVPGGPSPSPSAPPGAPVDSPGPTPSPTLPSARSGAPKGTVTTPPEAPSDAPARDADPAPRATPAPGPGRTAPPGPPGVAPGLPTLPDHVVAAASGRGRGGPPEVPGPPADLAPGERGDLARAWAGAARGDWRVLAGFVGSQWDQELSGTIEVVADSVMVRDGVATGLVRNERAVDVGPIVVRAGDAFADAVVPVARPGEPVPFRLDVGDVDVSSLTWSATAPRSTGAARDLFLVTWWQRGVTDPRPVDTYLWTDPASGPRPMVVFGSATAVAGGMTDIEVAGAWIDDAGRVIAVTDGLVGQPSVAADGATDFVVATTGPDDLDRAQLMLWGWGR